MKLKNIGSSIVSVGSVTILPGETKEVKGYESNAALNFLIDTNRLAVAKDSATKKQKPKKPVEPVEPVETTETPVETTEV